MSIIAARLGHEVRAVDGSSGMVEKARRNMQHYRQTVEICQEDGVTLPLEQEESYDVIISRDAVWTLYDPEKAFRRWKDILKPGGRIIYFDGDYRTIEPTLKNKIHMKIADFLIYVTEKKTYETEVRFARIQIRENRWLNSPWRMDFWKYGYQGKKFIVIATKKEK